ncbi:MAG: cytochrome c-type biogenesis protein [Rhizomicrobium sp.]|jgi:cytochrome c-type biogenesis protein CcmH
MIRAILIAIVCLCCSAVFAQSGPETLSNPQQEARAVALQKEFRCLVCQGESLDESNALLAANLRRLIRARIERGDSDAQIQRYLVSRYGNFILMKPPLERDTYLLWFGPIVLLGIGGAAVALVILRARQRIAERAD